MVRPIKRTVCLAVALLGILLLLLIEAVGIKPLIGEEEDETLFFLTEMTLTRLIGGIVFLAMLINLGYRVLNISASCLWRGMMFCVPPFLVAINNFPFSSVIKGNAAIDAPPKMIFLLLLECLCVGFFEETAFRGVVFLRLLKRKRHNRPWAFISILLSSVVFGLVHLLNLFQGSSPTAVFLQIGYSSLIGAMCAVMLLKTRNIWLPVFVHGLFNFCGALVPTCGYGQIWDTFTVVLTVILSGAVTLYMTAAFFKLDMSKTDEIYKPDRI